MPATMTRAGSAVEFERYREALDHVRAVAGDGSLRDRHDRAFPGAGVVFGDDDDKSGDHKPDQAADEEARANDRLAGDCADIAPADDIGRRNGETEDRQNARRNKALVKRAHDRTVGAELDEEGADDRGDDAGGADRERIHHRRNERRCVLEEDRGEHHRRHHRHRVSLEQVGSHAGAIAHVVAHVVGDGRRIARVIFRNAGLDLANEVGADVGALGEDAAAEPSEDRNQRGAKAERDQRVNCHSIRRAVLKNAGKNAKISSHAKKRETGDKQASHSAGAKGDVEAAGKRLRRRLGGADIGAHRDVHANKACSAGQDGADGEANRHRPREQKPKDDEHDDADSGDGHVLAPQIGLRPFRHRARNLLHARRAGVRRHQAINRVDAVDDGKQSTDDNQAQKHAQKPRCKPAGAFPRLVCRRASCQKLRCAATSRLFLAGFRTKVGLRRGSGRCSVASFRSPGRFADAQELDLQTAFGFE